MEKRVINIEEKIYIIQGVGPGRVDDYIEEA